ncbi:cyclase family protein [Methylococcus sp. EFPC2]|uniref:cyclase family protein n=1 Tax=Methylococcus sp. EFPC2 TaxID=2812648 RepID=UPI0019677B98|nr:cyclase family protein [Methylococcus sp. EFPC2]QSA95998.1 cyclase family protein [Methylococcus sp. EFPC2]
MSVEFKALSAGILLVMAGCASQPVPWAGGHWVDLSHAFSAATLYWPTSEPFHLTPVFSGTTEKGYHYAANRYDASEHGGTHLDAPIHFAAQGGTVEQIPLTRLVGPAAVIDVSARALKDKDYRIAVADLEAWERTHGVLPEQAIVLLRTGYARYWPQAERYLGTAEKGEAAVAKLHFPGLDPEAARWLVEQRHIKAVGLDTASIDYGQSTLFESHQFLSRAGVPIFENVDLPDQLPATAAVVVALPMKIEGGSGAPLRIVAWVPDRP